MQARIQIVVALLAVTLCAGALISCGSAEKEAAAPGLAG